MTSYKKSKYTFLVVFYFLISFLHVVVGKLWKTRVRKEMRDLSDEELDDFRKSMWTMRDLSLEEGVKKYGKNFKNWEYFVFKHAISYNSPIGDQAHFGPCFMTFHRVFLLEFETALLSIAKRLTGLPYWDLSIDSVELGTYSFGDIDYIFSDKYFGSLTGNKDKNYVVTDGLFRNWKISFFNDTIYKDSPLSEFFSGNAAGLMKSDFNMNNISYVTRFPNEVLYDQLGMVEEIDYTESYFRICSDYRYVKTWLDWQNCIEVTRESMLEPEPHGHYAIYGVNGSPTIKKAPWFHSQAHIKIGSWLGMMAENVKGDMTDVSTSINDPIFPVHHANLDRNNIRWQKRSSDKNITLLQNDVLWEFPTEVPPNNMSSTGFPANSGCWIVNSTISYKFPFYPKEVFGENFVDIFPGSGKNGAYTHADILKLTKPGFKIYKYKKPVKGKKHN